MKEEYKNLTLSQIIEKLENADNELQEMTLKYNKTLRQLQLIENVLHPKARRGRPKKGDSYGDNEE